MTAGILLQVFLLPPAILLFFVGALVQPILVPFGTALFCGGLWLGGRLIAASSPPALPDEFGGGERGGWRISLLVHQGDAPMGSDEGILWIEDDRLYFAGRRTSFGLTADQADGLLEFDPATPGVRNDLELRLRHQTTVGPLGISFSRIDPAGRIDSSANREILEKVNRWIGRGTATGGQLPPLDLGPDAPTTPFLSLRAAASLAFWITLLASFPALILSSHPFWAVGIALLGLLTGSLWTPVWSPQLRLRAWLDRRRLPSRNH